MRALFLTGTPFPSLFFREQKYTWNEQVKKYWGPELPFQMPCAGRKEI